MSGSKRGGAGRGQGRHKNPAAKRKVLSQRYSDTELNLIKSVAGDEVGAFIHDAAIDRAQQFAEQGVTE